MGNFIRRHSFTRHSLTSVERQSLAKCLLILRGKDDYAIAVLKTALRAVPEQVEIMTRGRPRSPETTEALRLVAAGASLKDAAKKTGATVQTLRRIVESGKV